MTDTLANQILQYGLGGVIALVLIGALAIVWRRAEALWVGLQESWAARLEDSKAIQSVIVSINTAIQSLISSIDKRAGMTEALSASHSATALAVERQSQLIERLCRQVDEESTAIRRMVNEIGDRVARMESEVKRLSGP